MQENTLLSETSSRVNKVKTVSPALRIFTIITLLLLEIQFFVGMLVNLFVQVPSVHPGANAANYFMGVVQGVAWAVEQSPPALLIHASLGLLLVLASCILVGLAIASRRGGWIVLSILGWIGVVGAGFNGASFINYGHDFSSLLMSTGFLLANISYILGIAFAGGRKS
jgi:hypothetical protein